MLYVHALRPHHSLRGQYFLARIDTKLNAIFSSVQDILRMLDSAERAKLNFDVATTYLKFLITAVRQGRFFEQDEAEIRSGIEWNVC